MKKITHAAESNTCRLRFLFKVKAILYPFNRDNLHSDNVLSIRILPVDLFSRFKIFQNYFTDVLFAGNMIFLRRRDSIAN